MVQHLSRAEFVREVNEVELTLNRLRVQSCWPVTTTRTSTCLTPTTATGPTISGDTRVTATTPQVFGPARHFSVFCCTWTHASTPPPPPLFLSLSEGGELLRAVQRVCGQRQRLRTHLPVGQILRPHRPVHGGRQRRSGESEGIGSASNSAVLGLQRNENVDHGSRLTSENTSARL